MVSEVTASCSTGMESGFSFMNRGCWVMVSGMLEYAREMADCTSMAAPSMSRSISNSRKTMVRPCLLLDVMLLIEEMVESCFSKGLATEVAMVSGSAPGMEALTMMYGSSTLGISLCGN